MRELIWAGCGLALLWLQDTAMPKRLDRPPPDPTATPPA
jgi:hypothetical protein